MTKREVTEEEKLVSALRGKSLEWAREFWETTPDGSFEEAIDWLKGKAAREDDRETKELANRIIKATAHDSSGTQVITITSGDLRVPFYPESIWGEALEESREYLKVRQKPVSIRGLDYDLYLEARAQAIRKGKRIGDWMSEAIKAKLQHDGAL